MKIRIFKKGFNHSQDGPGNRLVYHLQGCNMYCPWCANPEGMSKSGTFMVADKLLMDSVCSHGAIYEKKLDRSICRSCITKECIMQNRNCGIHMSCAEYSIEFILSEIQRSSLLFFDGGGVTLSGGEPTLQFDATKNLLMRLKQLGIHTAIESNATHPKLENLFQHIDFLMMDFKHYDNVLHTRFTGIDNSIIKDNIKKAMSNHNNVLIRIPLIKGFNDFPNDVEHFVNFFRQQSNLNTSFEFLPYHEYGKIKWSQCGMSYEMKDAFVKQETLDLYKKAFKENKLSVIST